MQHLANIAANLHDFQFFEILKILITFRQKFIKLMKMADLHNVENKCSLKIRKHNKHFGRNLLKF